MFTTRITSVIAASILTLGSLFVAAPDADASAARLGAAFQARHAQAARSTQAAMRNWSQFQGLSARFNAAMRSQRLDIRLQAKRAAQNWLRQAKGLIDRAATDHVYAINALRSYLRYVRSNPQAQALLNQLIRAERGLRQHSREIVNIMNRVSRMR